MNFRSLLNGDTADSVGELPLMIETEEGFGKNNSGLPFVYDDGAKPNAGNPGHNPTIGYGINLRLASNMALVLRQMTVQVNGVATNVFDHVGATWTCLNFCVRGIS
jgi:hypothetical protein